MCHYVYTVTKKKEAEMLDKVLHNHSPPIKWHVVLQGHFEALEKAFEEISANQAEALECVDWSKDERLTLCLHWVDEVMPRLVQIIIDELPMQVHTIENGEAVYHGHDSTT